MPAPRSASHPTQTAGPAGCLGPFLTLFVLLTVGGMWVALLSTAWGDIQPAPASSPSPSLSPDPLLLAPLFTPEVQYWTDAIQRWAATYQLDPNFIATVMQIESCGNPQARSRAGALGLFQVMPYHFAPEEDPFDPETNARRGLRYLKQALQRTQGDIPRALAFYNGGPGTLGLAPNAWASETQRYVYWGSGIYQDAQAMRSESAVLTQWLAAGGRHLCQQAHRILGLP